MSKPLAPLECTSVMFSYPTGVTTRWTSRTDEAYVEFLLGKHIPKQFIGRTFLRLTQDRDSAQAMLDRLVIKESNILRALSSGALEISKALTEQTALHKMTADYTSGAVTLGYTIRAETAHRAIEYTSPVGEALTMEDFLEANPQAQDLSKKDVRKIFVVTKRLVKTFPKMLSKNTPLRGLLVD